MGVGINLLGTQYRIPPELAEELREIPRGKIEWLAELVAVLALIAQIVLVAISYGALPDLVPTQFGFGGQVNSYGGKGTLLFLLAGNIALYAMLTVATAFPGSYNFMVKITRENARQQYLLMRYMLLELKVLVCWLFFYINYRSMMVALSLAVGIGPLIWVLLGLIIAVLPLMLGLSYKWR